MPLYDYKCVSCGHMDQEIFPMSTPNVTDCPVCAHKGYTKQISVPHTDLKDFHAPIEMFSIAMEDQNEIRDFKRKCPDVECQDNPSHEMYGVPVASNRKQKLAALKAAGYAENN